MKSTSFIFIIIVLCFLGSCQNETPTEGLETSAQAIQSLKNAYQKDFLIGTALSANHINGGDAKATEVILREFNSITPENIMKSMHIHPTADSFYFEMADKFVELGEANDMNIVGHTLIWHSQLSEWIGKIEDKEEMTKQFENHINTIVRRYKGRIDGWDVVNEALNEDGTLRESVFLKVLGKDYLTMAFKLAEAADPEAELYYNDYNIEQPAKREGCIKMLKEIMANGGKIDGVGIQGHWSIKGTPIEEIEKSILAYSELGLKVMFTEVDLTVLPNPWDLQGAEVSQNFEGSPFMNPYPEGLPDSVQIKLAQRYADLFQLFLKHQDKISRVTFWGVNDGHSWLNGWPIKDRTNYPLLFDRNFEPKKAYHSVMELKEVDP
jgi:endo-1,4-beta-xylanase